MNASKLKIHLCSCRSMCNGFDHQWNHEIKIMKCLQQKEFKQYSTSVQYEELSNYEFQNQDPNGGWNFFLLLSHTANLTHQN